MVNDRKEMDEMRMDQFRDSLAQYVSLGIGSIYLLIRVILVIWRCLVPRVGQIREEVIAGLLNQIETRQESRQKSETENKETGGITQTDIIKGKNKKKTTNQKNGNPPKRDDPQNQMLASSSSSNDDSEG